MNGPLEQFCDELDALIQKWSAKPDDDQMSVAEIVGALETAKTKAVLRALQSEVEDA